MGPLFQEVTMKSILYFAIVLLTILSTTEAMRGAPQSTDRKAAVLPGKGARVKIPHIPKKCLNKNGKFSYAKLMNKTSLRDCQVVCHVLKMLKGWTLCVTFIIVLMCMVVEINVQQNVKNQLQLQNQQQRQPQHLRNQRDGYVKSGSMKCMDEFGSNCHYDFITCNKL